MLPVSIVDDFDAGCQRKAADPVPPADPLIVPGALPLQLGHEQEKAELLLTVNRFREIAHLCNDAAEERGVVRQIHKIQGTSGSKDHFAALEAHSTVQHG